jgi:hypothetical protein
MLKVENDKAILYSMGRCGTKSITHHTLGYSYSDVYGDTTLPPEERFKFFVVPDTIQQSEKTQILVLRDPKDRFMSGHQLWVEQNHQEHPQYDNYDRFMLYHGAPFLHRLNLDINFKILLFDNLGDYVSHIQRDPALEKRKWVENDYDWDTEMGLYFKLLNENQRITVEEFQKCFS